MNKYTQEQLKEMTNEQLDEIVALKQGFQKNKMSSGVWYDGIKEFTYHPSTNKEQAWDLMVKCRLAVDCDEYDVTTAGGTNYVDFYESNTPYVAVVIASILHLQESE